jgi:hypothetical protein
MVAENCIICGKEGTKKCSLGTINLVYCEEHAEVYTQLKIEMEKAHRYCIKEKIRFNTWKRHNKERRCALVVEIK